MVCLVHEADIIVLIIACAHVAVSSAQSSRKRRKKRTGERKVVETPQEDEVGLTPSKRSRQYKNEGKNLIPVNIISPKFVYSSVHNYKKYSSSLYSILGGL